MSKLKPKTIIPTNKEDLAFNAGIKSDPQARELDSNWHQGAKPAGQFLTPEIYQAFLQLKRPCGRPKSGETKLFTAI